MNKSNLMPALGAEENAIDFVNFDQQLVSEAIRAIRFPVCIDNVTRAAEVNASFDAGRDKGTVRFRFMPSAARFKAAVCGFFAALALCLPVGAVETTPLRKIGENVTAYQHAERNADAKTEKKSGDRRLKKLSEKGSWIHHVTFCIGFVAGLIAGIGLIYSIILLIARIWR